MFIYKNVLPEFTGLMTYLKNVGFNKPEQKKLTLRCWLFVRVYIATCFLFKGVEFDPFKIRVVNSLQDANLNAISLCAKVPPHLPSFTYIPFRFVVLIHFWGDKVNVLPPALLKNPSNSRGQIQDYLTAVIFLDILLYYNFS